MNGQELAFSTNILSSLFVQVASTETGVIFGNIFYDGAATADSHCVVLNDIHVDILDYISPAYCNEGEVS